MASQGEDDLQASMTEGFKVGEKKTVEEYAKLGECMKLRFCERHTFHPLSYPPFNEKKNPVVHNNAVSKKNQVCTRPVHPLGQSHAHEEMSTMLL